MRKFAVTLGFALCAVVGVAAVIQMNRPAPVTLTDAVASPVAGSPGVAHVFLRIGNGPFPDRLLSASSSEAEALSFAGLPERDAYAIPANGSPSLSADGVHLVATGIEGPLEEGRLIPISLEFERGGTAVTRARVGGPADPHAAHRMAAGDGEEYRDLFAETIAHWMAAEGAGEYQDFFAKAMEVGRMMAGDGEEYQDLSAEAMEAGRRMARRDWPEAPEFDISVSPGADGAWNVTLRTRRFTFDPPMDYPLDVPGHGHGHLYLDGVKLGRMYSETATIGTLPPGSYTVKVSLNTNNHRPYYTRDGKPVVAHASIEVE